MLGKLGKPSSRAWEASEEASEGAHLHPCRSRARSSLGCHSLPCIFQDLWNLQRSSRTDPPPTYSTVLTMKDPEKSAQALELYVDGLEASLSNMGISENLNDLRRSFLIALLCA